MELPHSVGGDVKWYNHFEKLADSYKGKYISTQWPRNENVCPQYALYKNVHIASLKTGNYHMFINRRKYKLTVVYSYNGILLINEKEQTTISNTMDDSKKH